MSDLRPHITDVNRVPKTEAEFVSRSDVFSIKPSVVNEGTLGVWDIDKFAAIVVGLKVNVSCKGDDVR